MKYPTPAKEAHEKFCTTEGWECRKTVTGKTGTHHHNYELELYDGRILYTRISHPADRTTYGASMWSHILGEQLEVEKPVFWDCVKNGVLPDRGSPSQELANAIPAGVVSILLTTFHLPEAEVKAMTAEEAIARMGELFSKPPSDEGEATPAKP